MNEDIKGLIENYEQLERLIDRIKSNIVPLTEEYYRAFIIALMKLEDESLTTQNAQLRYNEWIGNSSGSFLNDILSGEQALEEEEEA